MHRITYLTALLLLLIAVSCQSAEPAGENSVPSETPASPPPSATSPAATAAAEEPTAAPEEPTTTSTPAPSATPAASSTPVPTGTPEAAVRLPAEDIFTVYAQEPVIEHGENGDWDGQFTDPGAVVVHEETFHIFRNGFVGWPAPVGISYHFSPDGVEWTEASDQPLIVPEEASVVSFTALASSALVEDDGTWVLYLYTWDRQIGATAATSRIIRATAPGPEGPWTFDPETLLVPGSEGEWDSLALRAPSVVKVDGQYLMFYAGYTRAGMQIGLATSTDGVTWEKFDDPMTVEAPFAESDPVFRAGEEGTWDDQNVYQPRVITTPAGLFMVYSSSGRVNGANARLGYAFSENGLKWVRSEDTIMTADRVNGGLAIWFTALAEHEGASYLFLEIGTGGETEIYLATREQPLPQPLE